MKRVALAAGLAGYLLSGPAAADTVHLRNGSTYEGVVARTDGDRVEIRLPIGALELPRSLVLRVERRESALEGFLDRREALLSSDAASAEEWLELARWAGVRGLREGYCEAALAAADLEPELPGLAPIMQDLGFELDGEMGRWVSREQYWGRRGRVLWGGEWLPPAEVERRERQRERAAEVEREADRERLDRAVQALLIAELERLGRERSGEAAEPPRPAIAPVAYFPGAVLPVGLVSGASFGFDETGIQDLMERQPGSLIPVGHARALRGGSR